MSDEAGEEEKSSKSITRVQLLSFLFFFFFQREKWGKWREIGVARALFSHRYDKPVHLIRKRKDVVRYYNSPPSIRASSLMATFQGTRITLEPCAMKRTRYTGWPSK